MISPQRLRRVTRLFAAVAIGSPLGALLAQGATITGTVKSAQGQALQAANVRISDVNVSVGTNENGVYRITLPAERVRGQTATLTVRAIGYTPISRQVTIDPGSQEHHFILSMDVNRVSEVVVTPGGATETKRLAFTVNRSEAAAPNAGNDFSQHLFPPELVMQHQSRLKLTDAQRDLIIQEVNRLQATATQVQWRVADEQEKLSDLLARDAIEEAAALQQVDKMIAYETAVKRAQLTMLIRIRNALTAEQRGVLQELRRRD